MSRSESGVEWQLTEAVVLDNFPRIKELVASHGLPSGGYTVLLDAVKLSRMQIVKYLVKKGAKVNSLESSSDTPLHIAVANGDLALVQMLLDSNAAVEAAEGCALLVKAVKSGHAEIVKHLLQKGAKVNSMDSNGNTLLHFAVINEDLALVQTLLESNAAVDAVNVEKETPLHAAAENGNVGIVRLLLDKKACCLPDKSLFTPLHLACFKQTAAIVELLLSTRAQLESADAQSLNIALLIASQKGNAQIVSALLNAGADPSVVLNTPLSHHRLLYSVRDGISPIHLACEGGYLDVVRLLVERKKELLNCVQSMTNFTPLHFACDHGHLEVVQYLYNEQADPNVTATGNLTPLHLAARGGHLKVVDVVCKHAADIEALTTEHLTPVLLAARNGHDDVVKLLLFQGADVNAKDEKGNSLLYLALENKSSFLTHSILQFEPDIDKEVYTRICNFFNYKSNVAYDNLIRYCISVKHKNVNNFSLAKAVTDGYRNAVEILLAHGFDPKNVTGLLHSAVKFGHAEILELLLNSGCHVDSENLKGRTAIYYLFDSHQKSKYFPICQSLLSRGANLNRAPQLLEQAVDYECLEVCELLLKKNVSVNKTGRWGETPLHHTVEYPYVKRDSGKERGKIARLLLENGANIIAKDNYDATALDRAIQYECLEVILILLEFKRDFSSRSLGVKTSLYYAIEFERSDIVEELHKKRVEVDAFERQDAAAMLWDLSCKGKEKAVELLLQIGVDINAQDAQGKTALHYAIKENHHEVAAVLLKHDCDVNIEDRSRKTPLGIVDEYQIKRALRNVVVHHMLKLQAAGLPISAKNKRCLREVWSANDDEYRQFEQECKEEVKSMKQMKLYGHLKLHDAIVKPNIRAFVRDPNLIKAFESVDLNQYPVYQVLIQAKTKKNTEINACKRWLRILSVLHQEDTPELHPELWLMIIEFLDKNDIYSVIQCGESLNYQL